MPKQPHRPAELVGQVFRLTCAIRDGLLTKHQIRSSPWRRLLKDVYADADLVTDHGLMCRAANLILPADSVIVGASAAWLAGIRSAATVLDPVQATVPPTGRTLGVQGIALHTPWSPDHTIVRDGLTYSAPCRVVWEAARWCSLDRTRSIILGLLASGLITRDDLAGLVREHAGQRGWHQLHRAVYLACRPLDAASTPPGAPAPHGGERTAGSAATTARATCSTVRASTPPPSAAASR